MINQLLQKIKSNKKYKSIANSVVEKEINAYFKINPDAEKLKQPDLQTVKNIRSKLHKLYSSFQTKKKNKISKYLQDLEKDPEETLTLKKLLSITVSTKERLEDYSKIYSQIFKLTKKPKTIIDLGAGLNPFSYHFMNLDKLTYYAYDIDEEDIKFLNKYFKIMKSQGLIGKAEILDTTNLNEIKKLPKSNLVFMFKVFDLLPKGIGEAIIKLLINKTEYIVTSFPTRTITRKKMNFPKRKGFELMLKRNNLKFKTIKTDNEIFYIVF
jgi:hypothetical protein